MGLGMYLYIWYSTLRINERKNYVQWIMIMIMIMIINFMHQRLLLHKRMEWKNEKSSQKQITIKLLPNNSTWKHDRLKIACVTLSYENRWHYL